MYLLLRRTLVHLICFGAKRSMLLLVIQLFLCSISTIFAQTPASKIILNDSAYFEKRGFNLLVFNSRYGLFGDEKASGIEIIHHGVVNFAVSNYYLHKAFPHIIDAESVFRGLNYLYGCHPGSNISLVSGVGTHSKEVAYGNNRADFSFIAGGVVPGVLILPPDFPENKEDWPFIWSENEYVVNVGASYIFLVNAANELLKSKN